jgi:hypothetical protein
MKLKPFFLFSALTAAWVFFGPPAWAAEGVIYKAVVSANYCHLKFPAIREETLYSRSPVLKDPRDGDVVDFYGRCDYDPLGPEEVRRQKADVARDQNWRSGDR